MSSTYRLHNFSIRQLATCLAVALSADALAGSTVDHASVSWSMATRNPLHPTSQIRTVLNCSDSDPDSLRDIITNPNNPNHAQSGDTVDLSQLPALCGMTDSTITLSSGEIVIDQNYLILQGPNAFQGTVTISGGNASRVFEHLAPSTGGKLSIYDLAIANGYYHNSSPAGAGGGCVESNRSVVLYNATIAGCTALADITYSSGGAIRALGDVTLVFSSVSGSQAKSLIRSFGGGIHATGHLYAKYSSISGNVAGSSAYGDSSVGGGAVAYGMGLVASTVDHNAAPYAGGLSFSHPTTILNSTISENEAYQSIAALYAASSDDSLAISNSTIAFNRAGYELGGKKAVHFQGVSASSSLTLQSSIIANNTVGPTNTPSDLSLFQGILSGADNLVMASSVSDPAVITVTEDPKLGPLQFNGGLTRTHALLTGSPAIGVGNLNGVPQGFTNDQRGPGYPRTTGTPPNETTDMGAFEFDSIFAASFEG